MIKNEGRINKIGRSIAKSKDYDAVGPQTKLVACPSGEIQSRVETVNTITLHDIDVINSREFLSCLIYVKINFRISWLLGGFFWGYGRNQK